MLPGRAGSWCDPFHCLLVYLLPFGAASHAAGPRQWKKKHRGSHRMRSRVGGLVRNEQDPPRPPLVCSLSSVDGTSHRWDAKRLGQGFFFLSLGLLRLHLARWLFHPSLGSPPWHTGSCCCVWGEGPKGCGHHPPMPNATNAYHGSR